METKTDDYTLHDEQASYGLHQVVLDILLKEKPGRVLDLGCGTGFFAKKLRDWWGTEVHVAEYRRELVRYEGLQVSEVDLNQLQPLPYEDNSFDYVLMLEVIEHIKHPWFIVEELARILKPGGKVLITTPNVHHLASKTKVVIEGEFYGFNEVRQSSPLSHLISFTVRQLKLMLNESGMSVERVTFSHPIWGRRVLFSEGRGEQSLLFRLAKYSIRNCQYLLCCVGSLILARSLNPNNVHFGASTIVIGVK